MRLAITLLCAVLLLGNGAGSAERVDLGNLTFRSIGPSVSGGRLGDVAGTDRDPLLYYAGAAGGGIWKSADGGIHWAPVFDNADVAPIGALAIDPSNENIVWAGTGEAAPRNDVSYGDGVYKSTDGGAHWSHMGLQGTSQIARIVVDPRDSRHVLVAALGDPFKATGERGVYETLDAGKTWKKTLYAGASSGASDLAIDPAHPDVVYAGMWQFSRTNWGIYSGGAQDGLFRSSDGGATWTRLTGHGLPQGELGRIGLAVAQNGRVYAVIQSAHGLMWRSDDGGNTWSFVTANSIVDERPFYFSRLSVDPTDPDHVYALSVDIAESRDGGKTWKSTGGNLGSDHHALWISRDGRRLLEGGDKGAAISLDGAKHWTRLNLLPVAQVYHAGYDRATPYHVCEALQDNGTWCAPSNSLSADGILAHDWLKISGGDGTWAWPDPLDRRIIWYSSGGGTNGGDLWLYDERTKTDTAISPYLRDQNVVPPAGLRFRFNWESPIAFDPFDPHVVYYGGNVVFRTRDRGVHWDVISGDLTRNIKAHQQITGGITAEGTGAETSDTILALVPSPARRGELWVGTDDGRIQLTRDGGKAWRDVSPQGLDDRARVESIAVSRSLPGTAYAAVDRHFAGDRRPYVYATRDFGAHWRLISRNLPAGQFVRAIRQDPENPQLLYAGLEQSFWVSWNGGAQWRQLRAGLPPASVRDIEVQPDTGDLIVATHGRGVYILDDASALRRLASLKSDALLPVRRAYLFNRHESTFDFLAPGENPPRGALITIFQNAPGARAPSLTIEDARGRALWHAPLQNTAGLQRVAWPLCGDPPAPWKSAPEWNRGERCGAFAPPGTYSAVAQIGGKRFVQTVTVKGAPYFHYSAAAYAARHAMAVQMYAVYDGIDRDLNALDAMRARAAPGTPLRERLDALAAQFSVNPQNSQDDDFLEDMLRERVQGFISTLDGSFARPTAAQYREAAGIAAQYRQLSVQFNRVQRAYARL